MISPQNRWFPNIPMMFPVPPAAIRGLPSCYAPPQTKHMRCFRTCGLPNKHPAAVPLYKPAIYGL